MLSKKYILSAMVAAGFILGGGINSKAANAVNESVKVAYFGLESAEVFNSDIKPVFSRYIRSCKSCSIENMTPYGKDGTVIKDKFAGALNRLPADVKLIFINFNEVANEDNSLIKKHLLQKSKEGVLIVGNAGAPTIGLPSAPLKQTFLGSMGKIAIVGDMGARDRLHPTTAFYGPEMLLAVRPPKDLLDKGMGAVMFAARWAAEIQKPVEKDWHNHFREVKMRSRKLWMDISDFF